MLELVSLDVPSRHAFVTEEGEALLRQYASNEVAFVMVSGNHISGKSFFCDKVLNLCEVRGNHVSVPPSSFAAVRIQASTYGLRPSRRAISRSFYSKSMAAASNRKNSKCY